MSRRTRRRRTGGPRCRVCHKPVKWFSSPFTSGWRLFNPTPVDPLGMGAAAYPVQGTRAWRGDDLVEELMTRWDIGHGEATDHVYAMPWHTLHACPTPDADTESTAP